MGRENKKESERLSEKHTKVVIIILNALNKP